MFKNSGLSFFTPWFPSYPFSIPSLVIYGFIPFPFPCCIPSHSKISKPFLVILSFPCQIANTFLVPVLFPTFLPLPHSLTSCYTHYLSPLCSSALLILLTAASLLLHPRCIGFLILSHPYSVHFPNTRVNQYLSILHFFHWLNLERRVWFCTSLPPFL